MVLGGRQADLGSWASVFMGGGAALEPLREGAPWGGRCLHKAHSEYLSPQLPSRWVCLQTVSVVPAISRGEFAEGGPSWLGVFQAAGRPVYHTYLCWLPRQPLPQGCKKPRAASQKPGTRRTGNKVPGAGAAVTAHQTHQSQAAQNI